MAPKAGRLTVETAGSSPGGGGGQVRLAGQHARAAIGLGESKMPERWRRVHRPRCVPVPERC